MLHLQYKERVSYKNPIAGKGQKAISETVHKTGNVATAVARSPNVYTSSATLTV